MAESELSHASSVFIHHDQTSELRHCLWDGSYGLVPRHDLGTASQAALNCTPLGFSVPSKSPHTGAAALACHASRVVATALLSLCRSENLRTMSQKPKL